MWESLPCSSKNFIGFFDCLMKSRGGMPKEAIVSARWYTSLHLPSGSSAMMIFLDWERIHSYIEK